MCWNEESRRPSKRPSEKSPRYKHMTKAYEKINCILSSSNSKSTYGLGNTLRGIFRGPQIVSFCLFPHISAQKLTTGNSMSEWTPFSCLWLSASALTKNQGNISSTLLHITDFLRSQLISWYHPRSQRCVIYSISSWPLYSSSFSGCPQHSFNFWQEFWPRISFLIIINAKTCLGVVFECVASISGLSIGFDLFIYNF